MTQIISVFSLQEGEGRTTVATTIAKLLGTEKKVLYVELDAETPTFSYVTGLSDSKRNMLNYVNKVKENGKLDPTSFIFKEEQAKVFSQGVSFLTFSSDYNLIDFPNLVSEEDNLVFGKVPISKFADSFIEQFKRVDFDVVIFVLPHDVSDLFGLPIMLGSDYILNVCTTNKKSLQQNRQNYHALSEIKQFDIQNRWKVILNKYTTDIPKSFIETTFGSMEVVGLIVNDNEKIMNDMSNTIGSSKIDASLMNILRSLQLSKVSKRGFFK